MHINRRNPYKPRAPHSIEDSLDHCIGMLGVHAVAEIVDKSTSIVKKWADQHAPQQISLRNAEKIDRAMHEAGCEMAISLAYQARLQAATQGQDPPDLIRHIEWSKTQAEQAKRALKHNGMSPDQYARARRLAHEAACMLLALVSTIDEHERERDDRRVPRAVP